MLSESEQFDHEDHVEELVLRRCSSVVKNCAICGSDSPYSCKMCLDNYMLNTFTDFEGNEINRCMGDFCQNGYKKVTNKNGLA